MSEPTYSDRAPARGDWSQVYTGLDWVAQWMNDHGYTDAEIGYVVGTSAVPQVPHVTVQPTLEPVDVPVDVPVDEPVKDSPAPESVETEQTTWIVPLYVPAPADLGDAQGTESPEHATA
jgi:hypothetical protein